MPRHQLKLLPNPWHSIDHNGRPTPCPKERVRTTVGHQGYIGAVCVATVPAKLPDGHQGTPEQDTRWQFSREPKAFDDPNHYYFAALRNGEAFPADAATAKYAGIKYAPYDDLLAASREEAAKKWMNATGEKLPDTDPFAPPFPPEAVAAAEPAVAAPVVNAPVVSDKREDVPGPTASVTPTKSTRAEAK